MFSIPLKERLFLARRRAQQCAIAVAHQREAALNQANGPIAQIMRAPVAFGDAFSTKQDFRYFPVGAAVDPGIKRTQGEPEPPAAMCGKRMQRRPWGPAVQRSPEAPSGVRTEFKIAVERKFDSVGAGNDRCFLEPIAMLYLVQKEHGVPTVRALPQLPFGQVSDI